MKPTLAPPCVGPASMPFPDLDEEVVLVDVGYLDTLLAAAPPIEPTLEEEIAAEPLPAARDFGGPVASPEYMRRVVVMARRERRRRGLAR